MTVLEKKREIRREEGGEKRDSKKIGEFTQNRRK